MVKTVEIEEELKQLLREELTDPNENRRNDDMDWIFSEKPKTSNTFPLIIISLLDNQKEGLSIGKTDRFHRHRIQVSIRVGDKNTFDLNDGSNEDRSAGYTKNWLAERIDEIVQNNQSRFRGLDNSVYSVLPDSSNPISPGNTRQTSNDYILKRKRG